MVAGAIYGLFPTSWCIPSERRRGIGSISQLGTGGSGMEERVVVEMDACLQKLTTLQAVPTAPSARFLRNAGSLPDTWTPLMSVTISPA